MPAWFFSARDTVPIDRPVVSAMSRRVAWLMPAPASRAAKSYASRVSSVCFNKRLLPRFRASCDVVASRPFIARFYRRGLSSVNLHDRIDAFFSAF
jgi:hypothetical protein